VFLRSWLLWISDDEVGEFTSGRKRKQKEIELMAVRFNTGNGIEGRPKKTRQGRSERTKLAATSRNGRKKKYRGQGR